MRKMVLLAVMLALAALMMAAAPAIADDRNKKFDHDDDFFRFVVVDDDFDDDDFRFVNVDDDFDDFFDDGEQEAESGDVDQSFVVTGGGDNSNQCVGIQGTANTGNVQNAFGVAPFDDFVFDDFDEDGFDDFVFDDFVFHDFDGDGFDDFEIEDSGAEIDVSGTNTTTCDQQVNQAASAAAPTYSYPYYRW
jgi:hypothetical protein